MNADTDSADKKTRMEKIDVRVPPALLEEIDEAYSRRGYASRSEAVRDALRGWLNPSPELSDEFLTELEESREQREQGETVSAEETRKRLGLGENKSSGVEPDLLYQPEIEERSDVSQTRLFFKAKLGPAVENAYELVNEIESELPEEDRAELTSEVDDIFTLLKRTQEKLRERDSG